MRTFKDGPFPTLVAVVTTLYKGVVNATPITWFTPCSYEPPLLFMALKQKCDTLANLRSDREFVLQTVPYVYAQEVHNLAAPCPRDKSELNRDNLKVIMSKEVVPPRLEIAQEWFECTVTNIFGGGYSSHSFILAEVLYSSIASLEDTRLPLLNHGGLNYLTINANPELLFTVKPYKGDSDEKKPRDLF